MCMCVIHTCEALPSRLDTSLCNNKSDGCADKRQQQQEVMKSVTRSLAVHGAILPHRYLPDEQQPWKDAGISGRGGVKLLAGRFHSTFDEI
jgi:hypothetical protein